MEGGGSDREEVREGVEGERDGTELRSDGEPSNSAMR